MKINDLSYNATGARYGYNDTHEQDLEVNADVNYLDFGNFGYDTRVAMRRNQEPLRAEFPYLSSYSAFGSNPIKNSDPSGYILEVEGETKEGPQSENVVATRNYIAKMKESVIGRKIIDALEKSKEVYVITFSEIPEAGDAQYDYKENKIILGNFLIDESTNIPNKLYVFSHEIFHAFQDEKSKQSTTPSIKNEVEAYIVCTAIFLNTDLTNEKININQLLIGVYDQDGESEY